MAYQGDEFEQPMSLITTNGRLGPRPKPSLQSIRAQDEVDLLTMKIMEASERKMRLIKELLSPEEYQSLSSELFASLAPSDRNHIRQTRSLKNRRVRFNLGDSSDEPKSVPPLSTSSEGEDETRSSYQPQRLSKSEGDLRLGEEPSSSSVLAVNQNIQENLNKKRQAMDFFFTGDQVPVASTDNLAIDLRFGYYLTPNLEAEDKLMDHSVGAVTGLGYLMSLIVSLYLGFINLGRRCCDSLSGNTSEESDNLELTQSPTELNERRLEKNFQKRHRSFNNSPYNTKRNTSILIGRLRRDQQFHKIARLSTPKVEESRNQLDLQRSEKRLILIKTNAHSSLRMMSDLNKEIVILRRSRSIFWDHATESKFLMQDPIVAHLTQYQNKQRLGESKQELKFPGLNFGSVSIQLDSLKLQNHKLTLNEERLTLRLKAEFREYLEKLIGPLDNIVEKIIELADKFIGMHQNSDSSSNALNLLGTLFELVETRAKLISRVEAKQRKLSMIWNEIKAIREEQGFNSTGLALDLSQDDPQQAPGTMDRAKLSQLNDCLREMAFARDVQDSRDQELHMKHLKRLQKVVAAETSQNNNNMLISVNLTDDQRTKTRDEDCPEVELQRRRKLRLWMSSLHLELNLEDDYSYDLPVQEFAVLEERDMPEVDLSSCRPIELKLNRNLKQLKLIIKLSKGTPLHTFDKHLRGQKTLLVSSFELHLPYKREQECQADLEVPSGKVTSDHSDDEATRLSLNFKVDFKQTGNATLNSRLIDRLHSVFFKPSRNGFIDEATKASELVNQINMRVLLALLGKIPAADLEKNFCVLQPHLVPPFESSHQIGAKSTLSALPNIRPVTLRAALLAWRWFNAAQSDLVYLSDRENLQNLTDATLGTSNMQLLDQFREKVKSRSTLEADSTGYPSIEQKRSLALDYIRRCELLIEQIIYIGGATGISEITQTTDAPSTGGEALHSRRPVAIRDLLREPRLKFSRPNLPNLTLVVRALVPRPTAHRPLMPNRRRDRGGGPKMSKLVEMSHLRRLRSDKDLESEALDQWRRFAERKKSATAAAAMHSRGSLRLVVTIQQASNVPLRLVPLAQTYRAQQQQGFFSSTPIARSASPFYAPYGSVGGGTASPIQPQQNYLAPSTTYVEAIFQRQQQASSLAQGKSPAWNETLFFNVDLEAATGKSGASTRHQQLADEFLHLNLYDCRCYVRDPIDNSSQLMMSSDLLGGPQSLSAQALLMPAQHQRIERHLLGSLQVPMNVLLTTGGRIEGSFALDQPLMLDHNYQFDQLDEGVLLVQGGRGIRTNAARTTSLSLFITLDPPVSLPQSLHLPTGTTERADLFAYARLWERVMLRMAARPARARRPLTATSRRMPALDLDKQQQFTSSETLRRHIRALVLRDDARYCLTVRFLTPMQPPESLLHEITDSNKAGADEPQEEQARRRLERQMKRLARFVSLLNPLKYGLFNVSLLASSFWFGANQLVNESLGGQEEKAVLLCNYFLHLGKCAALLLGDSIPDGRCIYVIVWSSDQLKNGTKGQLELQVSELMETLGRSSAGGAPMVTVDSEPPVNSTDFIARLPILMNSRTCQLWDPRSGSCYSTLRVDRQQAPLISVGSIVTCENIYTNMQAIESGVGSVSGLNFDIRQRHLWFPLFSPQALPSDHYTRDTVEKLESSVTRDIQRKIFHLNWRRQLAQLDQLSKMIGRPSPPPSSSLSRQLDHRSYTSEQCRELREALERAIKSQLLIWRPTRPTYFNRTLARMIAEKFADFERRILGQSHVSLENEDQQRTAIASPIGQDPGWWRSELGELIRSEILDVPTLNASNETRQVISWPINLAYMSMRVILDGLYASGVHNADLILEEQSQAVALDGNGTSSRPPNLSIQFLVACHVEPYPAQVMSVWLCVGAVVLTTSGQHQLQLRPPSQVLI